MFSFFNRLTVTRHFLFNLFRRLILVETSLFYEGTNYCKLLIGIQRLRCRSKSLFQRKKPPHSFVDCCSCEIFTLYSEFFLWCIFMMILFQIQLWIIRNQTKLNCWTAFSAAFWRFFSILAKKSSSVLIACISSSLLSNFLLVVCLEIPSKSNLGVLRNPSSHKNGCSKSQNDLIFWPVHSNRVQIENEKLKRCVWYMTFTVVYRV